MDALNDVLTAEEREHITKAEAVSLRAQVKRRAVVGPRQDDLYTELAELNDAIRATLTAVRERMPKTDAPPAGQE